MTKHQGDARPNWFGIRECGFVVISGKRQWELGAQFNPGGFGAIYHAVSNGQEAVIKLVPNGAGADRASSSRI
jgi:hypothetical protein